MTTKHAEEELRGIQGNGGGFTEVVSERRPFFLPADFNSVVAWDGLVNTPLEVD